MGENVLALGTNGVHRAPEDTENIEGLVLSIAEAAWDRKAQGLTVFDVRGLVSYADYLVLASANTERHVSAIANSIERGLRDRGIRPLGVEGKPECKWVLLDFGDVVTHLFTEAERDVFGLDSVWVDAPRLEVEGPPGLERPEYR